MFGIHFSRKRYTEEEVKLIRFVENSFGYRLKDLAIFKRALTHKSFSNSREEAHSNERLEFLGDAVLDTIVAHFLFLKFPHEDEGYLTKIKSKIVNRTTLSAIAERLKIGTYMYYNSNRNINMSTLEGNALEALIGAIYLDSSYHKTREAVENHLLRYHVDLNELLELDLDFKSQLYIWTQKHKLPLSFEIILDENDGSTWRYISQVRINQQVYGKGEGSSKKIAEQAAAKETLALIGEI